MSGEGGVWLCILGSIWDRDSVSSVRRFGGIWEFEFFAYFAVDAFTSQSRELRLTTMRYEPGDLKVCEW